MHHVLLSLILGALSMKAVDVPALGGSYVESGGGVLAQHESAEERKRDLERPSDRQLDNELGDERQRELEQPDQRDVEDPDARQEDLELGDERQRELEGRENY